MTIDQKGFGLNAVILVLLTLTSISLVGWRVYIHYSDNKNEETKVAKTTELGGKETTCESRPIVGTVEFDIAQPAPFVDERVRDISGSVSATGVQLRDGTIVKIDGKDYSSGKYTIKMPQSTEAAAVMKIKTFSYVTYVAQSMSYCPPTQPMIKTE